MLRKKTEHFGSLKIQRLAQVKWFDFSFEFGGFENLKEFRNIFLNFNFGSKQFFDTLKSKREQK